MGISQCGGCGTTAALALLNDAVKKGGVMASSHVGGLSGAFIPVSEDEGMIAAANSGCLTLEKLEAMTAVCSVGLDMIAVPGDTSAAVISALIADELAIGVANTKTTAVRLIPGATADIESLLGKPTEKLEAPSCIHEGNDIVYYYDGLEIVTSPGKNGSTVISLTLTSDAHKTEEGIAVGSSLADATAAYGAHDSKKSSPDFGRYVFLKSTTSLTLLTDADNIVTSISYTHEG